MKVLAIAYKGNEIARFRITTPLILVGRSPLCDILLRAPGVASVQFIFEWIGAGEFNPQTAHRDEWAVTEVGEKNQVTHEKKANKSVIGSGAIFDGTPLQLGEFVFQWIEDRLVEADLNKKIISQQVESLKEGPLNVSSKNVSSVLEVISINRDVDSVSDVVHFSFLSPRNWNTPLLRQFRAKPKVAPGVRSAEFSVPQEAKMQLIRHGGGISSENSGTLEIALHDVLHVEWQNQEYYFRVVPKVYVPAPRRAIWSDPFYIVSVFCILIGGFGFYLIFRNVKNERQTIVAPPRIAQVQVVEVKPQEPIPEEPPKEEPKAPLPPEPEEKVVETKPDIKKPGLEQQMVSTKNKIQDTSSQKDKEAPAVVDRNKGGLNLPAEKAPVNRTGFLAALKKNKNVGMVKADQILDKGLVNDSVKGKSGDFVLEQSASGMVNNQLRKQGDALSAASTQVNMGDKIGSGSLNVAKGDVTREGFKAEYGVSGEGGLNESNFNEMLETQVQGGLDRASVQSAIRGYKAEIRTCYERALRLKSSVGGRVSFKFQITPQGSVGWINVHKSDIASATLVECVQGVVKGIDFPKAKNGQSTIVIYPFQFARKGT